MNYEDLEKHFKEPKNWQAGRDVFNKDVKRVPRKFKKRWKNVLQNKHYSHFDLRVKLWIILGISNPNYKSFLIKKVCEYGKIN